MRPVFLSVLALFAVALAQGQGSVTGKYRLLSSRGSRAASTDGLTLRVNGRFLLEADGKVLHGDYRVEDDLLTLRTEDGDRLRGEIRDGRVTLEDWKFERTARSGADLSVRRFPTDASSGRLGREESRTAPDRNDPERDDRPETQSGSFGAPFSKPAETPAKTEGDKTFVQMPPVVLASPLPAPTVAPPAAVVAPAPRVEPVRPKLKEDDLAGVWTVRRAGLEEKGWRLELRKNGDFRFAMKGATSEGSWTVVDNEIVLVYKKIDGEPLEEGAAGVKRIPCAFDGSAFQIDTFRYERASDK